ncbi:MAG: FIST C-terminal domain-containing protein [Solirubrobacterales bacterium]|nr:FIST C-terminal domain-containing protein [Solirubrobacterales bacterium]
MRVGAGMSQEHDPLQAGVAAALAAAAPLNGSPVDLALVFASGAHLVAPEAILEGVHTAIEPDALIGCGAGGVLGVGREIESGTALAVWAAAFEGAGGAEPFQATASAAVLEEGITGLPALSGASGVIMLSDPYTFPTDSVLSVLGEEAPAVPVLGGIASARMAEGGGALFLGEEVCDEGAVAVRLDGIEMLPCVSQGAVPVGRELAITGAEDNLIHELAGRPALAVVEEVIADLSPRERALVAGGLLIGIVVDGGKPEFEQGDFLVRGLLGADPEAGSVAVAAPVRTGQIVRLHARDAASADEDLTRALRLRIEAMGGRAPAGALVFSCNGRGSAMFGVRDHDASAVQRELEGAPAAGFFAAGEIGPVGGRSFLHGFTATLAVFPR